MYVRDLRVSGSDIEILGVRHSSIRDTRYVKSKINNKDYDLVFVEKHPDIGLESYEEQTRRIVGHIFETDTEMVEFDTGYEESVPHDRVDDSLDGVDVADRTRLDIISDVREKIRDQSEDLYEKVLENRENAMIRSIRKRVTEQEIQNVAVIVGEVHVNPISQRLGID